LSRQISCIIARSANTRNRVLDDVQLRALALVEAFAGRFERAALSLALKPIEKAKMRGWTKQVCREVVNLNMIFGARCKENKRLKNHLFNLP